MVQCKNCGLLSVRAYKAMGLVEVSERLVNEGQNHKHETEVEKKRNRPICAIGAFQLGDEWSEKSSLAGEATAFLMVVQAQRECDFFIGRIEGVPPSEHRNMMIAQRMKEDEARRIQQDREWRDKQETESRRWRIIELLITVVLVTGVSVAAQIASAFIERGSLFPPAPHRVQRPP